jgi:hypothetical protein
MKGNLTMIWARVYAATAASGARPDKKSLPSLSAEGTTIVYIAANGDTTCHACASKPNLGRDIVQAFSLACYDEIPLCGFCGDAIFVGKN